jgi:hypothetical protein
VCTEPAHTGNRCHVTSLDFVLTEPLTGCDHFCATCMGWREGSIVLRPSRACCLYMHPHTIARHLPAPHISFSFPPLHGCTPPLALMRLHCLAPDRALVHATLTPPHCCCCCRDREREEEELRTKLKQVSAPLPTATGTPGFCCQWWPDGRCPTPAVFSLMRPSVAARLAGCSSTSCT